jgi:CBS domain-containing protein
VPQRHAARVRTRLTVLSDGTTDSSEIVFCEGDLRSVSVSRCEACPFVGPMGGRTACDGVIDCGRSLLPATEEPSDSGLPPAVASALPVGLALARSLVCVRDDLPWVQLARVPSLTASTSAVPVVDCGGAFVGLLPATEIARAVREGPGDPAACVSDRATSVVPLHETQSLGGAFAAMGARRARELPVVADGGSVVGVLRDLDALRFVAHMARTGSRPAPAYGV